jgi:heme exporter protein A
MSGAMLSLSGLSVVRGGRMLFTGVDLRLKAGEAGLLRGPNGTGKSSLIRAIAGLLPVFAGTVNRNGAMALADEALALDLDLPLLRALTFWAGLDGSGEAGARAALAATGLSALADIPVRMLSTGQRKRAVLARVLASEAPIWLLDEPANGLDTQGIAMLGELMTRHLASGGIILAASHQPLPFVPVVDIDLATLRPAEDMGPEDMGMEA